MLPAVPKYTCPLIDAVKEFVTDAQAYAEDDDFGTAKIEDLQALYDHVAINAETVKETLENIRDANAALRTLVEHYEEEVANHEATVETLQNEIEDLKREIRVLS